MSESGGPAPSQAAAQSRMPSPMHVLAAVAVPNTITLLLALRNRWPLDALLWPYWLQLVIHGGFNYLRMRRVENLPLLKSSRGYVPAKEKLERGGLSMAAFFGVHYSAFTLLALFLMPDALSATQGGLLTRAAILFALAPRHPLLAAALAASLWYYAAATPDATTLGILTSAGCFAATQGYEFFAAHRNRDQQLGYGLTGVLLFAPDTRLAPMYLFCAVTVFVVPSRTNMPELVMLFVAIKSVIEYFSWGLERRMLNSIGLDKA